MMKSKEQRKHRRREMSRTWLRARLLALTMGVCWCFYKPTQQKYNPIKL